MLIWSANKKLPDNLRTEVINIVQENYTNKKKFFTSYTPKKFRTRKPYDEIISRILSPYYGNIIEEMMKNLGIWRLSKYKYSLWVQMYNSETTTHKPHSHYGVGDTTIISFNHIIDASKNKCFYFLNDNGDKIYPDHQESGDIFAWPSWLVHGVDQVQEPNLNRLIVAGNVSLDSLEAYYFD